MKRFLVAHPLVKALDSISQAYINLAREQSERISMIDAKHDSATVLTDAVSVINNLIQYESKKVISIP